MESSDDERSTQSIKETIPDDFSPGHNNYGSEPSLSPIRGLRRSTIPHYQQELKKSRVYIYAHRNLSVNSFKTSESNWTQLSGRSLSEISRISVVGLPINLSKASELYAQVDSICSSFTYLLSFGSPLDFNEYICFYDSSKKTLTSWRLQDRGTTTLFSLGEGERCVSLSNPDFLRRIARVSEHKYRLSYILARADINIYRKAYPNGIWGSGDIFFQYKPQFIRELRTIISSHPDLSVFGNSGLGNAVGSEKCSDLWSTNFLRCFGMVLVEIFLGKPGRKISPAWPDVTPEFIEGYISGENWIPPKVPKWCRGAFGFLTILMMRVIKLMRAIRLRRVTKMGRVAKV
jgi:hypothetical protein